MRNVLSNTLLNLIMFHRINRSLVPMEAPWPRCRPSGETVQPTTGTEIPQKDPIGLSFTVTESCNANPACANLTRRRDKKRNSCSFQHQRIGMWAI